MVLKKNDMLILGIILMGIAVICVFIGINTSDYGKKWITLTFFISFCIFLFSGLIILSIDNNQERKRSFKIIKVDSTHIYKINEKGDSLIIENR